MIVVAPTRAACETIELALGLHLDTVLERQHGAEIRDLAAAGKGFGIVAGTGTGKTLATRSIAEATLRTSALKVGVVNREREATPETPTWNVIIVTTGIARRWFQDGDILARDTLIVDEIHQTSAELELVLALGKRVGCRFIWLSATVDPRFYASYLNSATVIESSAFDPAKAATVRVARKDPADFLDDKFLQQVVRHRRGVGMFLPTRASVEQVAVTVGDRFRRITTAFYHGGEPIRVIRPFLEEGAEKPFFLAMTAAGQSALNIKGLDTVVIDDTRFANVVEGGKNVLTRLHLGANEILQMAGRVHGRVAQGEVYLLTDRDIHFPSLKPTAPEFQLAGDSERVALTCAALGLRADQLDLPVPLDGTAYRKALAHLEARGVIENGRLSRYGKSVEALPVERAWAELLVHAPAELLPPIAVMASIESLHRMTRDERDLSGLVIAGSDHLTAYNVYADALRAAGSIGQVYGFPRHIFDERSIELWAERRGVLVKAIEDTALAMASVCRALDVSLPSSLPKAEESMRRRFCELVARIMPFDLVIDEQTSSGQEARVSKSSVCGSWGAIAGSLRFFSDRFGVPRASVEGTQIPADLIRKYATPGMPRIEYRGDRRRDAIVRSREITYFGFTLEREEEYLDAFPDNDAAAIRRSLARALASEEANHPAVGRNRNAIREARELYRRSGGTLPRLTEDELAARYESMLVNIHDVRAYRAAPLKLDLSDLVATAERERLMQLPDDVEIRDVPVRVEYEVENGVGIARVVLPERLARLITQDEVPSLDRPVQFVVYRGHARSVRAYTLAELQAELAKPVLREQSKRHEREEDHRRHRREQREARPQGENRRREQSRKGRQANPNRRRKPR